MAKPKTIRATRAATARTMIANMMIGLLDALGLPASRLPPAVAPVDRDHPRFSPDRQAPEIRVFPDRGHGCGTRARPGAPIARPVPVSGCFARVPGRPADQFLMALSGHTMMP
jgi:hypothetical protein